MTYPVLHWIRGFAEIVPGTNHYHAIVEGPNHGPVRWACGDPRPVPERRPYARYLRANEIPTGASMCDRVCCENAARESRRGCREVAIWQE